MKFKTSVHLFSLADAVIIVVAFLVVTASKICSICMCLLLNCIFGAKFLCHPSLIFIALTRPL